jgi:K+-sensing histidine kinase KdpD
MLLPLHTNGQEFKHLIESEMKVGESRRRAEALSKENETLLRILCHDLASPLQAGRMSLAIARDDSDNLVAALESVDASFAAIESLVVQVRKLKSSTRLRCEPVNLQRAVKRAVDMVAAEIAKKRCNVVQKIDARFEVIAEENGLTNSVISNLLNNAVKFSHEGSEIEISAFESADSVELKVSDYGVGMATETVEEAFAGRPIAPRPGTTGELGTGFGLQIALRVLREYPNAELAIRTKQHGSGTDAIVRLQRHHPRATSPLSGRGGVARVTHG